MENPNIMGAIVGDTIGSVYEFNPVHNYDFKLFTNRSSYTDDSVMTIAVAEWLLDSPDRSPEDLVANMQKWGRRYPNPLGSYGGRFYGWLFSSDPQPYNSWGNGSAMRVGPVGFACDSLEETLRMAEISAAVTHNHPEGIKGAQATAAAIYLARTGSSIPEIRDYITATFGYNLTETYEQIRDRYSFDESCQGTVPESIVAFIESTSFEDAIRKCVSMGGDADTMGAITGAIAAAFYREIPDDIYNETWDRLPADIRSVIERFSETYPQSNQ